MTGAIERTKVWKHDDDGINYYMNFPSIGYRVDGDKYIDDDRYIISDDFKNISKTRCRVCKNKIVPYSKRYEKHTLEYGIHNVWIRAMSNGYCESCAKKGAVVVINHNKLEREYSTEDLSLCTSVTCIQSDDWAKEGLDPKYDPDCAKVEDMGHPVVNF